MLKDKVIVITGASRGIGEAIARACIEAGARVALASRKQAELDKVVETLPPERAIAIACHTGKVVEVDAMFAKAVERFGRVDGLVNNAATNPYFGPLLDTPDAAIDKTIEVNMRGYFYCARAFVRQVRAQSPGGGPMSEANQGGGAPTGSARGAGHSPAGSIVNVASVAGTRAAPMQGVYGMTKAAVISMTQTLAFELGSSQIRVNAIAPGLVETRFASALVNNPMLRDHIVKRTPLARHAQPAEIAGAAVYLLSDAASFTTGAVLVVDGGMTAT